MIVLVRNSINPAALVLTAITIAMPTCYGQVAGSTKYSNSLIEVSGAQNPTYLALSEGREQLTYTVAVEYPADKIVAFVSSELQKKGWKPLREDFLNPGTACPGASRKTKSAGHSARNEGAR